MIKKFLSMVAIAGMVFTTSCSSDEFEPAQTGEEAVVSFTAELPASLQSRTFGDGKTAVNLSYFVYGEKEDGTWEYLPALSQEDVQMQDRKASVNLSLVNGEKYNVVFWADAYTADATGAPYTFVAADAKLTVNYTNAAANDENRDAFYKVESFTVNGNMTRDVELKRPFAQINIGTTDWADVVKNTNVNISQTSIKVKAYSTLNFKDGDATDETTAEFELANMPNGETFPVENVGVDKYLSMNYILVDEKELVNVTINYDGGVQPRTFTGVPVQRNYRTNIYGKLLTSDQGFNVEILPAFNEPDFNEYAWNGQMTEPQAYDEATKTYSIYKPEELAWIAALVNGTLPDDSRANLPANNLKGKTVKLMNDISLGGLEWTPIGTSANQFKGTFDGQGYTISNLKVSGNKSNVGLFGMTTQGEIKNLTVENAEVSGYLNVGVVAGTPYDSKYTNITVKGLVKVNGFAYVGGVGGKNAYDDWTDVTVDVVEGSYVNAQSENYRTYVGGVVGFNGEGGHTFKNIKSNINVTGSTCDVGGLFGIAHYNNKFENCSSSGVVTVEADDSEIGGIAGVWHNQNGTTVTFTNCSFTGKMIVAGAEVDPKLVGSAYSPAGTGKLIIDGSEQVEADSQDEVTAAVTVENATVNIAAGEYTFPKTFAAGVTLVCEEGTVFTGQSKLNINGATVVGAKFSNPDGTAADQTINGTFKDCVFEGSNALRWCYAGETVVFENCTFTGDVYSVHFDGGANDATFKNCTFSGFNAFGGQLTLLTLEGCKFVSNPNCGYNGANLWGSTKMTNCEFTFDGSASNEWIDCIKADGEYVFDNCTVNNQAYTAENYTVAPFNIIGSRNNVSALINGTTVTLP